MIRQFIITICAVIFIATSLHATRPLTAAETDSVLTAVSTIWANSLNKKILTDSTINRQEYMQGVTDALKSITSDDRDRLLGIQAGVVIDQRLKQIEEMGGFKIDRKDFAQKLQKVMDSRRKKFTPESAEKYMNRLLTILSTDDRLVKASQEFMDSVAKQDGIEKTISGLLFETIKEGEGASPEFQDQVIVKYTGKLFDGTIFDESKNRPSTFEVRNLIGGFTLGLYKMKVGGKYRLYIPPELGYGVTGVPGVIPPNVAIIFDVELLEIKHPEKKTIDITNN